MAEEQSCKVRKLAEKKAKHGRRNEHKNREAKHGSEFY